MRHEEVEKSIRVGIRKINIGIDLRMALTGAARPHAAATTGAIPFPATPDAERELDVGTAILDGETVVLDNKITPTSGRCSARLADAVASEP